MKTHRIRTRIARFGLGTIAAAVAAVGFVGAASADTFEATPDDSEQRATTLTIGDSRDTASEFFDVFFDIEVPAR
jgi:hypothetical protein